MIYTNDTIMPFGKHKGEKLANVPASYLLYLLDKGLRSSPIKTYIEYLMENQFKDCAACSVIDKIKE